MSQTWLRRAISENAPLLFVLLWSTGFIGAKYGLPYAPPYTLLFLRFVLTLTLLGLLLAILRPTLPVGWRQRGHLMVSGLLVHGAYLGGVFSAIKLGMSASLCALVVGAQPLLTAIVAPYVLGERIGRIQWLGTVFGFVGLYLVLGAQAGTTIDMASPAMVAALAALGGITAGTLYQKRYCADNDVLGIALFQYLPTTLLFAVAALLFETTASVVVSYPLVLSILWLAIGLSLGAIGLLSYLLRQRAAYRVSTLFYLVPAVTALEAFVLLNETLTPAQLVGMAIVAAAVYLVTRSPATRPNPLD